MTKKTFGDGLRIKTREDCVWKGMSERMEADNSFGGTVVKGLAS